MLLLAYCRGFCIVQNMTETLPHNDLWPSEGWLHAEFARTISDLAQGLGPRTVTHALLSTGREGQALTQADILAITGQEPLHVEHAIMTLEEERFVTSFQERGFLKHVLTGQASSS